MKALVVLTVFALALFELASPGLAHAAPRPDEVRIDTGRIVGEVSGDVVSFKGIPYAAPPVGPLRWRAPQPPARWHAVRSARAFGDICIQADPGRSGFETPPRESEDCLYVNVWRPLANGAPRPVLVWIYGGALVNGASSLPVYDGAQFARRGIILVSFNYRLGRLGFFAHPALTREGADGGLVGNYALMDEIAALRWVARNIRAFGGDPRQVTIFGESAGAASVDALMITPSARGLFRGAIAESGYGRGPYARLSEVAPDGKPPAEQEGVALMKAIGVETDDPKSLRSVPLASVRAMPAYGIGGAMFYRDGRLLTDDLWEAFRHGREAPVPFMLGSNSLETPPPPPETKSKWRAQTDAFVRPEERPRLAPAYGGDDELELHLSGDVTFAEQAWRLAALHASHGHPAWRYRFAAVAASVADRFPGAPHGSEIPYVFDTLPAARWAMGQRDQALTDAMIDYWIAFARSGKPAPAARPSWPPADGDHIMIFGNDGPSATTDDRAPRYRALAEIVDPRS